jgi:hypothetical protein
MPVSAMTVAIEANFFMSSPRIDQHVTLSLSSQLYLNPM